MLIKLSKRVFKKCGLLMLRALPFITTAVLVINTNSTASMVNGQPKPPAGLEKYKKFR